MIGKKLMTRAFLAAAVLGTVLSAVMLGGCTGDTGTGEGGEPGGVAVSRGVSEREGGEHGGEHGGGREGGGKDGSGGEGSGTGSEGGGESGEAAMSSPVTSLGESWNGVLGGLAVAARYDEGTQAVIATVRNSLDQTQCFVQVEPHLKSGTQTVGELGPDQLGDLKPGQEAMSSLSVSSEPNLAGVAFDGYVMHLEVFDCGGPGPIPHSGGEGVEGGGANSLALDETFDMLRSGARMILKYDAPSNSFNGTVENTTNGVLDRVRVEVHLSNGTELGPTTPTDMAPGEVLAINLPATQAAFTGWTAHAEVGSGGEGSESGGEHGPGGERGSGRESGGEHGSGGERRGGG